MFQKALAELETWDQPETGSGMDDLDKIMDDWDAEDEEMWTTRKKI